MDYEDDMNDANDVKLFDDHFYSSDADDCYNSDNADADDYEFVEDADDDSDVIAAHRHRPNYTVLTEADIRQCQEDDITRVCTVLSIPRDAAIVLLRHCNWSVSKVYDAWFDGDGVQKVLGLLEVPVVQYPDVRELTCGICFESNPEDKIYSAACGHPFCSTCWAGYISTSINDAPRCLSLKCPDPSCCTAIGESMVHHLAPDDDKKKYSLCLLRSYIEDNRKTKWCPAPGCEYAVEFVAGVEGYDVSCLCSFSFCWNCGEEAHRPVDCGTAAKWKKKIAVSENMNWILANSKPCPKCKRPIEKNQGCSHMTCAPPCKFEFCWRCLGAWSDHGERTGGFYACNSYEAAKQEEAYDEAKSRREMAKHSLEGYTHYYEGWASNQSSRQKALADLHQMQTVHLEKLSDTQCQPESQLKFIIDAWQQIIECRRVLKWTYAYGYYLSEYGRAKKQFFEYLQGEAEFGLERLDHCAEKELHPFLSDDVAAPSSNFNDFRTKLVGLTGVTKNFFENLVKELENGLSVVDPSEACSRAASSKNGGGTTSSKGKVTARACSTSRTDDLSQWSCDCCTFVNMKSLSTCQMCQTRR